MTRPLVIVFGGSRVYPGDDAYEEAYRLGALLARAGFTVGSGGYQGVMEAVSRGAREAGGHVVGYTCDIFEDVEPNPWLSEERRTRTLTERIERMAQEGDAFIALHGGIGTLAELTVVWNLLLLDHLGSKPFLLVGDEWLPLLETFREHTQMGSSAFQLVTPVATPEEAVAYLQARDLRPEEADA
ncbi:MAG: LOG family protein [Chloroflexi bacterium]|nr:LOG family protein [Chloroflexota bacterium]